MIGRTLGNYRIIEQIGMGGMATVYKAYDPDTDRYVAIKVLPEHFSKDPKFRQRFEREAKAIAKLEHIHILPLFAYGEDEGVAYMVMRYLDAGSLTERIRKGALPLAEASRLLGQIASALDHAHAHGVLHRDVKPSNVLLDSSGNAFLMDFGIAKMVESALDLTGTGILGTPAYMSPEQCRGAELTPASDQYSLGIILYEMVIGRTPFRAETPIALIHMQLNEPLPLPRQVMPGLPEEVERVILKALTKDPSLRFPTCGEMAAAFARAVASVMVEQPAVDDLTIASGTPAAVTTPVVEEATMLHGAAEQVAAAPRKRRRLPAWVLGLMAVLVVLSLAAVAIVVSLMFFGEEEETPISVVEEEMVQAQSSPEPGPVVNIEPPTDTSEVRPCDWEGHGNGLCIYAPPREEPIQKILQDAGLDLTGPVSWSPDGRQIAFSAITESQEHDMAIYIVNADGTELTQLPQVGNDLFPAWSPNGEWVAFHSNCGLAVMHPDGSEPSIIWQSEEGWCTEQPQWSPDSQSIVVSVLQSEGEALTFPVARGVWVVTDEGDTLIPLATLTYNNDNCLTSEVAFSPDGTHVAYVNDMCQTLLANADGSGVAKGLADFPFWWTVMAHPQWGEGVSPPIMGPEPVTDAGAFYEDFDGNTLEPSRWEPGGYMDKHTSFLKDGQFRVEIENDLSRPWDGELRARLSAPVKSIDFEIGLDEAEGGAVGFGVYFVDPVERERRRVLLNAMGDVLIQEGKERVIKISRAKSPLPVQDHIWLNWEEGKVVIYVDDEPVGKMDAPDFASEVGFWGHLDPGDKMMGYLDDVHIAYATEGEIFEPVAPQPISGEPFEVKLVEPCPDKKPPQICIIDAETQQTTQVTSDLEFESTVWLAWSPDGQQIVFDAGSVPETGRFDHKLYLINADGSGLKQLTSGDTNDIFPAWSPDGNLIAFHRNCSLWVVRPDGSQPRELLGGTDKFCASTIEWSPDSQRIAFLNKTDDGTVPYQVFVLDPGETVPRLIHAFDRPQEPHLMSWSRDGRQLALWFGEPDQEEVFLINADGSGEPKLMDEHIMEAETVWTWLPNFWPRWGDEQGASSSLPPPDAPKSDSSAPDDPWGQVVIPPGGTVNLAFVGALSGDIPDLGEVQQNAFLMALDDLPTVKEFPVEASIIADGGCTDPDLGRQAAELVVSEPNIVGVVGHSCSPSCAGGAPVYEQAHLVLISPSCTSSDLTEQSLEVFNRVVVRDDRGGDEVNLQITDTPAYQEFADRYQRHYSQTLPESDLAPLAAYAYDATALLIKTIEFVSVVDGAGNLVIGRHALAEAVRAVPGYQGVTGVIGFDSKGDRQLP